MFTRAIVRIPASNFADGLTTVDFGAPDYQLALAQHREYCQALERLGLALTVLEPDDRYPDSTFVEDTAIVTDRCAIITRPGAASRAGETESIALALAREYPGLRSIEAPGTVDGGDICEAGSHFYIGISERTNEEGARQLAALLEEHGYSASTVDIHGVPGILHLKSGISYIGENRLVAIDALAGRPELGGLEIVNVSPEESYAANCVRVNDAVLIAKGYPKLEATLRASGYRTIALDMSEYRKMDGGLSCLSLRF